MKNINTNTERRLNRRNYVIAIAAVAVMAIAGISAYLMDIETVTNTFTIGDVDIQLTQDSYTAPAEGTTLLPNQEYSMDPAIENTGDNPVYAFIEVTVPYENIKTVADNGTVSAEAEDTALFSFGASNSWRKIGSDQKDTTAKTITRVYAYASSDTCKALAPGAETENLFTKVRFVNTLENEVINSSTRDVVIKGIAIQTTGHGKALSTDVWAVASKQIETQTVSE